MHSTPRLDASDYAQPAYFSDGAYRSEGLTSPIGRVPLPHQSAPGGAGQDDAASLAARWMIARSIPDS